MNRIFIKGLALFWALPLLAALAAGCARVKYPDQNLEERLSYDQSVREQYPLDPDWWTVYGDSRLNRLMELGFSRNLDLAKAAVNVNRALYQANLLGADLLPAFSGGLDASARKNIRLGGPSVRSAGGDAGVNYELDLWRKMADSASAQQWEYQATVEDRQAARLALAGNLVDAYFHLAYISDAIDAGRRNLKHYQDIEQTVLAKYQAGKVPPVEPDQARQAVLSARNTLLDFRNQREIAEQTLRNLLNLKPDEALDLTGLTLARQHLPGLDLEAPLAVLANRPDLRAAEFRLQKSFKNVEAAEKAWLPSITLGAALGSSGDSLGAAFNMPVASGLASINLPFLDWSRVLWNVRISETDFENSRLDFEQALTTALNEVATHYRAYGIYSETLDNTRRKYAYDQKISDYHHDRYQAGAGELSDWLSALATANSSRLAALNALYQALHAENLTYKAMAGRYTF